MLSPVAAQVCSSERLAVEEISRGTRREAANRRRVSERAVRSPELVVEVEAVNVEVVRRRKVECEHIGQISFRPGPGAKGLAA